MKLEKLIIGNFAFFVEGGSEIDGVSVSKSAFPDVEPAENWHSMGCVSETTFETEKESDEDYCPSPMGGYQKIKTESVVRDTIKFKVRQTSELFWRLSLGLKEKIVNSTPQAPFSATHRYIEGWLKIQGRGDDGKDRVVMNVWGRLYMDENPKWSKDPTKPSYAFDVLYSPAASVEPADIV